MSLVGRGPGLRRPGDRAVRKSYTAPSVQTTPNSRSRPSTDISGLFGFRHNRGFGSADLTRLLRPPLISGLARRPTESSHFLPVWPVHSADSRTPIGAVDRRRLRRGREVRSGQSSEACDNPCRTKLGVGSTAFTGIHFGQQRPLNPSGRANPRRDNSLRRPARAVAFAHTKTAGANFSETLRMGSFDSAASSFPKTPRVMSPRRCLVIMGTAQPKRAWRSGCQARCGTGRPSSTMKDAWVSHDGFRTFTAETPRRSVRSCSGVTSTRR